MPTEPSTFLYRTEDLLRWGAGKGSNLTPGEVDENFWMVEGRLQNIEDNPILPKEISSVTVLANKLTFHMDDGVTSFGPFSLPEAAFRFTGEFQALFDYKRYDLLTFNNNLYMLLQDHTSGSTFVFEATTEGPVYALLLPNLNVYDIGFSFPGTPGRGIGVGKAMFTLVAARDFYLPANLPNSHGTLQRSSDTGMIFSILKNETIIGSFHIGGAGDSVSESESEPELDGFFIFAADVQFHAGDRLRVLRPTILDTNAEDLALVFAARKGLIGA